MELDDVKQLYYSNLVMLRRAMHDSVTEPLGIDNKWYWAEDRDEGETEIRERVERDGSELVEFLRLHGEALDHFDNIESRAGSGDYQAMFSATDSLLGVLERYERLVTGQKERLSFGSYLEHPHLGDHFNAGKSRQGVQNMILALGAITTILRASDLTGFKLGELAPTSQPYVPRDEPSHMDGSYRGMYLFVRHDLTKNFGLQL